MDDKIKKQKEAVNAMMELLSTMKEAAEKKITLPTHQTEDDMYKTFEQEKCPYDLCDGSGYTKETRNGKIVTIRCKCYKEMQVNRRLDKSNIPFNFREVELESLKEIDPLITITHLKPLSKQLDRKVDGRKKVLEPESPDEFVKRTYTTNIIKNGVFYFTQNYINLILSLLNSEPKKQTLNLMLMGDPGKGKTHVACAIAKEFMRKGKSVYFTTMRALLDEAFESKIKVRNLVRNVDLLIIDELSQEYHTDSKYALKQIQDIFKERQETRLPIICTTNAYPNELSEYYEGSLMSTFNGRFLMMLMHGEYDLRILEANKRFDSLDFLN